MSSFLRNLRKSTLASSVILIILTFGGCGGVQGTYADPTGGFVLQLQSGNKAVLSMMGQTGNCTYTGDGDKISVTCEGITNVYTKSGDTLNPPPGSMIGALKKK
jgi:hypothetical protein